MTTGSGYDPDDYPRVAVTVDLVVLTLRGGELCVLLVERGEEPWRGASALPGGFVRPAETLDEAAARELVEETGLRDVPGHLEQLRSYGDPGRDPRMRVVSVAYLALAPDLPEPAAGTDAAGATWVAVEQAMAGPLAFDHARILADGVERARAKLEYTSLATAFCPPEFTVVGPARRLRGGLGATGSTPATSTARSPGPRGCSPTPAAPGPRGAGGRPPSTAPGRR